MRFSRAITAVVAVAVLSLPAAACGGRSAPAAGASRAATPSPSADPTIAWIGRYSADDGRSVDPQNGYGSALNLKLPLSVMRISRTGGGYKAVIATPSLTNLPPNTLLFKPASNDPRSLVAAPAPLTRITLHALDANRFTYVCRVKAGGAWTLFSTMTFQRVTSPG